MREFGRFCGRILLLCLPQLALSLVAILAYSRAIIFPVSGIGTHLAVIALIQVLFFSSWAVAARQLQGTARPWFRRLYAASCLAKGVMLNAVYLASYTSYRLWAAYLTWANLKALGPHLHGFRLALGWPFFAALALGALAFAGYFLLALKLARPSLRWLEGVGAGPAALGRGLMLAALTAALATGLWLRNPQGEKAREQDPVLAFWTNQAASAPPLTAAMLADRAAGQDYRVPGEFSRRNVIVLVVDCLRADHLSFRGYDRETTPFLASLDQAGRLHQVDFAVSNGNDSPQGIRSILNALPPHRQNIHNFRLQDLLHQAGYRTHVLGTGDHTTLGNMREYYGPNVDVFLDGLTTPTASINDDRGLLESLDRIGPAGGQPAFFYIHLMSAHELGVRTDAFARWQPATLTMDRDVLLDGKPDPAMVINSYDNGILEADHYLREIFGRLEAKGYLRDYVAVIAGDHGQGLGEHGSYGHTRFLAAEDVNIPILFLESGPADYGPLPFASQVDIAPTLIDRLGLPKPVRWAGQSLYRGPAPETAALAGRSARGWRAVVWRRGDEIFKYIFNQARRAHFQEQLYASKHDPAERHNLVTDPAHAELLLEIRRRAAKEFDCPVPPSQ